MRIFLLLLLPAMVAGADLKQEFYKDICRLHKKSVVELCQIGCEKMLDAIWLKFTHNVIDAQNEGYRRKLIQEGHRCDRRCEEIQ